MPLRPSLSLEMSAQTFRKYNYDCKEMKLFCQQHGGPTTGAKAALIDRIAHKLACKRWPAPESEPRASDLGVPDSARGELRRNTPVQVYKSDAATQAFFKKEVGEHFHVNGYLRSFKGKAPAKGTTYGQLIAGWEAFEAEQKAKKKAGTHVISSQFKYNQFQSEWSKHGCPVPKQVTMREAWEVTKNLPGEQTYKAYKEYCKHATLKRPRPDAQAARSAPKHSRTSGV
eukprot:CAMPEP_0198515358 /NCGR_PEP_ID=MMETSP1462-20131121/17271_1 /TAXON_ID=1333877 /ORGANISM="Brandtodinium nutriculum, Strain RCC3387" /LENGTH=227 /DNA_ID=CAMNT_0044244855 /DNA_START=1 /DNA_END=684 /DNA_ORIENTATION=+